MPAYDVHVHQEPHEGVTVAVLKLDKQLRKQANGIKYVVGSAHLSAIDSVLQGFDPKKGREIAIGRATKRLQSIIKGDPIKGALKYHTEVLYREPEDCPLSLDEYVPLAFGDYWWYYVYIPKSNFE